MTPTRYVYASPIGPLTLVAEGDALTAILFGVESAVTEFAPPTIAASPAIAATIAQLDEYFARQRTEFTLPLKPAGTPFQKLVWQELSRIPYGETISYGELARRIGNPSASRAVGLANGKNPLPIVVPCHRVIGANGALTGFGGGIARKEALLALERRSLFD